MHPIRSITFTIVFFVWNVIFCGSTFLAPLLPDRMFKPLMRPYFLMIKWIARIFLGIKEDVRGSENLPDTPFVLACKHQSAWETIALQRLFPNASFVLKQELTRVPFWGRLAVRLGHIPIERDKPVRAMATLVKSARLAAAEKRTLIIFPQGTRVPMGETQPYLTGVFALYNKLDMPVVPAALNSGVFWPKSLFGKRGGTLVVDYMPTIATGLDKDTFMTRLEETIEKRTGELEAEAIAAIPVKKHRVAKILATVAGIAFLGLIVTIFVAEKQMDRQIDRMIDRYGEEGIEIAIGTRDYRLSGNDINAIFTDIAITEPEGRRFTSDSLRLSIQILGDRIVLIEMDSPSLRLPAEGLRPALNIDAENIEIQFDPSTIRTSPEAEAMLTSVSLAPEGQNNSLTAETTKIELTLEQDGVLLALLNIDGINLPGLPEDGLGARIEHIVLDSRVAGPIPAVADRTSLTFWRDQGGLVDIANLTVENWGPLTIGLAGRIVLDAALQPAFAGITEIRGIVPTVTALADNGLIPRDTARWIGAGLAAMSERDHDGATPVLRAPLSIEDRWLRLGTLKLTRLPTIEYEASDEVSDE
ncbi:MAG: DUF2125 domain-containing protein [Pseudomonadota bacterium]|nr:DUF2125 domain-containing protein [Pseudomonadota bacterium]